MSTQTEAQRRAAARKAKILARGNAGLARLAQTARGEEADKLYGDDLRSSPAGSAPSSRPETPVQSEPSSAPHQPVSAPAAPGPASPTSPTGPKPGWANPTPGRTPTPATRAAAADPTNLPGMGPGEMPDFNAFMQQMMAGMGPGGPGGQGFPALAGPGGEGADPFGGQDPFAALMAQMGGGGGDGQNPFAGMPPGMMPPGMMPGMGMPGMPGMGMAPVPPSKTQRLLPLIHALAVIAFTIFVVVWWEPTMQLVRAGGLGDDWSARWKGLGGRAGGYVAKTFGHLPVFYAFSTLEAMLLAFRVVIVKPQPRLHPLLANVLPMLPLNIQRIVVTGSKYLGVVGQTYADACLFIFGLGCAVVIAEYL